MYANFKTLYYVTIEISLISIMTWKRQNIFSVLVAKYIKYLGTFPLYLICVFWITEAVIKYLNEPSNTFMQYSYGDNGKVPEFPSITFCDHKEKYSNILISECDLQLGNGFSNFLPP